ncbi:MAG: hypothetical protein M0Q44_14445 [Methylobacter sp.]|nr:hypothetical protein [Methylobacter sp.]
MNRSMLQIKTLGLFLAAVLPVPASASIILRSCSAAGFGKHDIRLSL